LSCDINDKKSESFVDISADSKQRLLGVTPVPFQVSDQGMWTWALDASDIMQGLLVAGFVGQAAGRTDSTSNSFFS